MSQVPENIQLATLSKWDRRFIQAAKTIASWSPDPSSQIGAIAISKQNLPLAWGWNAFPRHTPYKENEVEREVKYKFVVHAEMNAIYNASRESICLLGSTFYIYGIPPCLECAKGLVQVGAQRIVSVRYAIVNETWLRSYEESAILFSDAKIRYAYYTE